MRQSQDVSRISGNSNRRSEEDIVSEKVIGALVETIRGCLRRAGYRSEFSGIGHASPLTPNLSRSCATGTTWVIFAIEGSTPDRTTL